MQARKVLRMNRLSLLGIATLAALMVVSCTGNAPAPTQSVQNNATTEPTAPLSVVVTLDRSEAEATEDLLANLEPGVLSASETEDPERALVFDLLEFRRYGGGDPVTIDIVLNQDGTFTRNGQAGTVSPETVIMLDNMLDEINFFGLQAQLRSLADDPSTYKYSLAITRAGLYRVIDSEDGYMPQEYIDLMVAILDNVIVR
jgi:hypothetical protein